MSHEGESASAEHHEQAYTSGVSGVCAKPLGEARYSPARNASRHRRSLCVRPQAKLPFDGDELLAAFTECSKYTGDVPLVALRAGMEQVRRAASMREPSGRSARAAQRLPPSRRRVSFAPSPGMCSCGAWC